MKATPREMMRLEDGVILPYSETLVRKNPGKFAPVKWEAASRRFLRDGDAPLVAPPPPPPPADGIPDDDDDDDEPADYVDPEPETAPEEPPAPKATRRRKSGA